MEKKTALFDKHVSLGAKIVPFAGFEMPVQYSGVTEEHFAVREKVGIFDVSHMGQFFVEEPSAKDLLQYVTTNNVDALEDGKAQYSCLPNGNGGIVDDLIIYKMEDEKYFVVVNASNIEKDWNHISKYNEKFGAKLTNASDEMSLIAIQGPKATETLQKLTDTQLSDIPYYHFTVGTVAGVSDVIISNTGYTGSGGFEVYFKNESAEKIWDSLTKAGEEFGLIPCGLASRDTLRLEKGFCLYGNDIDDTTSPLEAGLGWITKFDKDFVDKEFLAKQKEEGVTRKLVGFSNGPCCIILNTSSYPTMYINIIWVMMRDINMKENHLSDLFHIFSESHAWLSSLICLFLSPSIAYSILRKIISKKMV